jgi:DNA-binding response OmpR family regulator
MGRKTSKHVTVIKMSEEKKILVVDDEPDNASIFTMGLEDGGFEVDSFTDPLLALSAFKEDRRRRKYDLLILDIKMPDMNGFELYEQIKKIDNKVQVCFLTAFGEGYTEEFKKMFPSSSLGVSFIRKPIRVDDLVKKVKEMIMT